MTLKIGQRRLVKCNGDILFYEPCYIKNYSNFVYLVNKVYFSMH